ncbi:MAG TPA: cytochrome D1 domain-containing protein, partial [Armatimonadota bacterium]|nr:cytochrome D1 domain-containing protein [Armatimonadota bacterium]
MSSICFAEAEYLSPTALAVAKNGKSLYIAEYTAKQIAVYDIVKSKVVKVIRVSGNPSGLALDSDGKILYVTIDSPSGIVQLVDLSKSKPTDTIAVGHSPLSPVLSPDNKTLYVCNRFDNSVSVIDTTARKTIAKVQVSREPVSADITPDGKSLYVANFLPGVPANGDYVSSEVSVIDTSSKKVKKHILLPNGSSSLRGIAISPDGKYAYVTHILSR